MARYGYSTDSVAPVSPVLFNHRFHNLGMRYNNGIFIIEDPGYYRIEIKSYTYDGKTDSKYVGFELKINSSTKLTQFSRWAAAVPVSAVFYLNAFDTVFVSMRGSGTLAGGANFNDIQIEKID